MAKSTMTRNRSGNGVDEAATPTPESLDQVRDILFGGQMRMVDARLSGLEERLVQEQVALRNELTRKLEEVEGATRKELLALADRLSAERAKRAEDLKALGAEFKEAVKNLERRHQKLEETVGPGRRRAARPAGQTERGALGRTDPDRRAVCEPVGSSRHRAPE